MVCLSSYFRDFYCFSPLEQFELCILLNWVFMNFRSEVGSNGMLCLVIDNSELTLLIGFGELWFFTWLLGRCGLFYRVGWSTFILFMILERLLYLVRSVGGCFRRVRFHLGVVFSLGIFIVSFNLVGLMPFGFCVTSQLLVTQFLGVFTSGGMLVKGIEVLGFRWINLFLPSNVPSLMVLFLMIIDFISYVSRMVSLSVRLFANMVAGHSLLHILSGACISVLNLVSIGSLWIGFVFFFLTFFILTIVGLEVGIAFLQGYVFVILYLIYMSDFSTFVK